MAEQSISEQLNRVIEEGKGRTRQAIVRVEAVEQEARNVIRTATYTARVRTLTTSARELLPSSRGRVQPTVRGGAQARKPTQQLASYSSNQLFTMANKDLEPITAQAQERSTRTAPGVIQTFPAARSVLVELTPDKLADLAKEGTGIADIYPNRQLRIPPVVEVKNLPQNVADNKASSWGVNAIGALATWGAFGTKGNGATVGVLDTGVDPNHPDLQGKIQAWAEFNASGGQVNSQAHDTDRHGTHVSGTIAGGNASGQWIGVAPDARLAVAMVLDGQVGGTDAQVLAGMDWAIQQGVDVISMSLGGLTLGPEVPSTYTQAIVTALQAGIPTVVAIGNDGSQTTGSPGNDLFTLAVGATDYEDRVAGFSGGRTQIIRQSTFIDPSVLPLPYSKPDVSAPGVAVMSSVPNGAWEAFNGTSMATPHVAGAVALLLASTNLRNNLSGPNLAFTIMDLLIGSVEELGEAGQDHRFGFGRIDVLRAIGMAKDAGH